MASAKLFVWEDVLAVRAWRDDGRTLGDYPQERDVKQSLLMSQASHLSPFGPWLIATLRECLGAPETKGSTEG